MLAYYRVPILLKIKFNLWELVCRNFTRPNECFKCVNVDVRKEKLE